MKNSKLSLIEFFLKGKKPNNLPACIFQRITSMHVFATQYEVYLP